MEVLLINLYSIDQTVTQRFWSKMLFTRQVYILAILLYLLYIIEQACDGSGHDRIRLHQIGIQILREWRKYSTIVLSIK